MLAIFLVLLGAYLLGSIPTATLVCRAVAGIDIHQVCDGNMGSRNVKHALGMKWGVVTFAVDFSKAALAVLLARGLGLGMEWQVAAGACAVLGHDFPIFAGFRGGQGLSCILGVLFTLLPVQFLAGLAVFCVVFLFTRDTYLGVGFGIGVIVFASLVMGESVFLVLSCVAIICSLPAKKYLYDQPRLRQQQQQQPAENINGERVSKSR